MPEDLLQLLSIEHRIAVAIVAQHLGILDAARLLRRIHPQINITQSREIARGLEGVQFTEVSKDIERLWKGRE